APPIAQPSSARPVAAAIPLKAPAAPPLPVPAPKLAASATRPTKTRKHSSKRRKKHRRRSSADLAAGPMVAPAGGPPPGPAVPLTPEALQVELVAAGPMPPLVPAPSGIRL